MKNMLQKFWTGQNIKCDGAFAFDTETTLIELGEIPELIVLTFSDNKDSYIVDPTMVGKWVEMVAFSGCDLVAHNVAFDYHVVHQADLTKGQLMLWREMADSNRLWDTMILDYLVRLANGEEDGPLRPRGLAELCQHYLGIELDKKYQRDWYRFKGVPLTTVPDDYLEYALKDSSVTRELFNELQPVAVHISQHNGCSISQYGPLTHHIQVKGSIALTDCSRVGIRVNTQEQQNVGTEIALQIQEQVSWLSEHYPSLFKLDIRKKSKGKLLVNTVTGVPTIDQKALRVYLKSVGSEMKIKEIPKTDKSGEITTSSEYWHDIAHEFVSHWLDMITKAKLLNFVSQIKTPRVNPRYQSLVRTGRTSCSKPNLQQMPRAKWFRKLFVPSEGCKFVIADYTAVELRCLAAICKSRFGRSRLAETFAEGVDPHAYTAASILNIDLDVFMSLKRTDPDKFKQYRQSAKAVNFGVPGGLGARSLMDYAQASYGVSMSLGEARAWKNKLITEVYPELSEYLKQDAKELLCANLQCTQVDLIKTFNIDANMLNAFGAVSDVVSGNRRSIKGHPYSPAFRRLVWESLQKVNNDPSLEIPLRSQRGSATIRRQLFGRTVSTLTGRVRGAAEYTESCNTQFQGLAADGAKLALYYVSKIYPVVAFVHDELVVEVPDDNPEYHGGVVADLMRDYMDAVLGGDVKSDVEWCVSDSWSKP